VAVAALAAASALAGCSGSSTPAPGPTSATSLQGTDDLQILNALSLGKDQVNNAFGVDPAHSWQAWTPSDLQKKKIALTAFLACNSGLPSDGLTTGTTETFFRAGDSTTTPPPSTSSGKKGSTPAPPPDPTSVVPTQWVGSVAAVYSTAAKAKAAAKAIGKRDPQNHPECAAPDAVKPGVSYVIGPVEVNPTWYGQNAAVVFVDTKQNATMTALAQQRGRFVIVTYTKGSSKLDGGYYTLNNTTDAVDAATAATTLLSQLTDAVVNGG
jgi:hypothetical protein